VNTHHTRRTALRTLAASWSAAAFGAWQTPAHAQGAGRFPERPISLLVPFAPGGIADLTARAVAEQMGRSLGQPVVVENKPSAGSIVASQAVATARPDGHTLLLMSNGHAVSVSRFKKLPYDPQKDFAPVRPRELTLQLSGGADCPRQGPPRQAQHRHHRRRQHAAPGGQAVRDPGRH
jgi:tripartite-type tricarboxylate transporter receptor subunit TctC